MTHLRLTTHNALLRLLRHVFLAAIISPALVTQVAAQQFTEEEIQRLHAAATEVQNRGLTGSSIDEAYMMEEILHRHGIIGMMGSLGLASLEAEPHTAAALRLKDPGWCSTVSSQPECPVPDCRALMELEHALDNLQGNLTLGAVAWGLAATLAGPFAGLFAFVSGTYAGTAWYVSRQRSEIGYQCRQGLACP
jgi:hypothetical protein